MKLELRPELERFVANQVSAGRFASPSEVIEAGLARLMLDSADNDTIDDVEAAAIRKALQQEARGDVVDWKDYSANLRKRYGL